MKVKDLIAALQPLNPEAEVCFPHDEGGLEMVGGVRIATEDDKKYEYAHEGDVILEWGPVLR